MRENINKIVGIKDGEVYVLESVFNDNGFKGATGYSMRPLTKEYVEQSKDPENLRELWKQAVKYEHTDLGLVEWAEEVNEEAESEGRLFATDDDSFREEFLELVETLPKSKRDIINAMTDLTWEVSGCGRHFEEDMKFDVVFDKKLISLINKYESKQVEEDKVYELCPFCSQEVELKNAKKCVAQECPVCKKPILPCNLCDSCDNACGQANTNK